MLRCALGGSFALSHDLQSLKPYIWGIDLHVRVRTQLSDTARNFLLGLHSTPRAQRKSKRKIVYLSPAACLLFSAQFVERDRFTCIPTPQTWRTQTPPLPCELASSSATLCWVASKWSCEYSLSLPRPSRRCYAITKTTLPPRFPGRSILVATNIHNLGHELCTDLKRFDDGSHR